MAEFLHERRDFDQLLAVVANDRGLDTMLVEKDYWIMHGLWGLQAQGFVFEPVGSGRSSRFFGLIGSRNTASTSSAFRGQFNSRNGN